MKRMFDIAVSTTGLVLLGPFVLVVLFLVWRQDYHSPLYRGIRVGRNGKLFDMIKVRSMTMGADKSGVESTGSSDPRITKVGHFVRRWKMDEVTQLWNVLKGDMSLVGPRPNTRNGVANYSEFEMELLTVRPGITDFSSIVFSDEGEIIRDAADPDDAYDKLIRPWKSRLGVLYVRNSSVLLDIKLIWLTVVAITAKKNALAGVVRELGRYGASPDLIEVCRREAPLRPVRSFV